MSRRISFWIGGSCLALGLVGFCLALGLPGCSYESTSRPPVPTGELVGGALPSPTRLRGQAAAPEAVSATGERKNKVILDGVITLIDHAVTKPGGQDFELATQQLNSYFANPDPADYVLGDEVRAFLVKELPEAVVQAKHESRDAVVKDYERRRFELVDARHLEDCMLYSRIARRVAGSGDDLTRVGRLFDWTVRQVQLAPPGAFKANVGFQAQARPFDVLLRGMATEDGAGWAERAWVFLSLSRQLDLDCGMLAYTPPKEVKHSKDADGKEAKSEPQPAGLVPWICVVLVDGKPYLFDARIGLPIAGPDGKGVATLQQALDDSRVLAHLELPGQSEYGTTRAQLLASPTKIHVLLDSTPGYFSPRMRLLQEELQGKDRTVLYRDPLAQRQTFAAALGPWFGGVGLWDLPIMVNTLLFTSGQFNEAARQALTLFDPNFPLVYARVRQLRGDTSEAISKYVDMRFAERPMLMNKKQRMDPETQRAMDAYSTYYLGLSHLEQNNPEQAEFFFRETLKLLPEPGPGRYYYNMFRWGAQANLGRLLEERGDPVMATAYYTAGDPTPQQHGNLLRARDLVWQDPTAMLPPPLPPAPKPPEKNILLRN